MITRTNQITTLDDTPVAIFDVPLTNNTIFYFTGSIVALCGATEEGASYRVEATAKRTGGGGSVLMQSAVTTVAEDDADWDVTIALVGNDVVFSVTGEGLAPDPDQEVNWYGELNHIRVSI